MENLTSKKGSPNAAKPYCNTKLPYLEIAKVNLRHNALLSIAVSVVFILLIPLITGTANLDMNECAVPLEMFASLIGVLMLTPVFGPEQNTDIDDLVSSKYVGTGRIYLIRTIYAIVILALLIGLFTVYLGIQNCAVTMELFIGTLSDAVFLGALGMMTSALCNNTVIAYMIPTVFYALNYGMGGKLGNYYLFSMAVGKFEPKIWMLVTGILLVTASILSKEIQKKFR